MSDSSPVIELRVALTVEDFDAAMHLYREALGLPVVKEFGDGGQKGAVLAAGRATLEIVTRAQADHIDEVEVGRPTGERIRLAMEVADSDGMARKLEAAGSERLGDPVTTPWQHRNVRVRGLSGVHITLFTVVKE